MNPLITVIYQDFCATAEILLYLAALLYFSYRVSYSPRDEATLAFNTELWHD